MNRRTLDGRTGGGAALAAFLALGSAIPAAAQDFTAGPWRPIFDGRTLEGWTPKIARHPLGDNWRQTFVVEDGAIRVSYAGYADKFDAQYGHLFYKTPFKAYRLRFNYRFLDGRPSDTPAWAYSNSGVMFHSQPPETMTLDQSFPVSVEFQFLGREGDAPRPTGAVCTPGITIVMDGAKVKEHCTPSKTAPTVPNGTWTKVELEVRPNGEVLQKINDVVVHRYSTLALDPEDTVAKGADSYIAARGAVPVTEGYIALQSEGHPIAFKDIEVQELTAR